MTETNPEELRELFAEMDGSITSTGAVIDTFRGQLGQAERSITETSQSMQSFDRSIGQGLRNAFNTIVYDGGRATDALQKMARSISNTVLTSALKPVQGAISQGVTGVVQTGVSSLISGALPFAQGGVMTSGRVRAFAKGGVVSSATTFPMRGGTGLMGEAGPEAIMPLTRGPDGSLGVKANGPGSAPVTVVMNISTPDADGFRKSRNQISAELNRALSRGKRNL